MNPSLLALILAVIGASGIVLLVVLASLISGALRGLTWNEGIRLLKSEKGANGFAFSFAGSGIPEGQNFDQVRVRLFNPQGGGGEREPTQVDIFRSFDFAGDRFARDLDMGSSFGQLKKLIQGGSGGIQVEISSRQGGVSKSKFFPAKNFLKEINKCTISATAFNQKNAPSNTLVYYHIPKRDFIAPSVEGGGKSLKNIYQSSIC